jgi:hypothetical protein
LLVGRVIGPQKVVASKKENRYQGAEHKGVTEPLIHGNLLRID